MGADLSIDRLACKPRFPHSALRKPALAIMNSCGVNKNNYVPGVAADGIPAR